MPERVFFAAGDPEYDEEKPDVSDIQIERGRKLIRVGLLMLVLGLVVCLLFIILVVGVVPASLATSSAKDVIMNQDQVHLTTAVVYYFVDERSVYKKDLRAYSILCRVSKWPT